MGGPIQQLRVVGSSDKQGVAWKGVDPEQQRGDDALYLTGLVLVAALLAKGVELIEEEDAATAPSEFEHGGKP